MLRSKELNMLEYDGFEKFMINMAYICFSKPPKDLRHLHIGAMFD